MPYTIYILRTSSNTLYTGITNNLEKRLQVHSSKKNNASKYVRSFSSFTLVYQETVTTRSDALKREYALKQLSKQQKEELIANS
ncbi:MAG TPA: GIY-YIG nuclease family protein [Candidatus Eisenbacteria bacterium]|nr:GIY-YIG nuclease family protein [Candidatus Eisenbacteria bacterium]